MQQGVLQSLNPLFNRVTFTAIVPIISTFGYFSYSKCNSIFLTDVCSLILNIKYIMYAHLVTITVHSLVTSRFNYLYSIRIRPNTKIHYSVQPYLFLVCLNVGLHLNKLKISMGRNSE